MIPQIHVTPIHAEKSCSCFDCAPENIKRGQQSIVRYLFLPCRKHPIQDAFSVLASVIDGQIIAEEDAKPCYHQHRYQCPECMKELEEAQQC